MEDEEGHKITVWSTVGGYVGMVVSGKAIWLTKAQVKEFTKGLRKLGN